MSEWWCANVAVLLLVQFPKYAKAIIQQYKSPIHNTVPHMGFITTPLSHYHKSDELVPTPPFSSVDDIDYIDLKVNDI